MKFNLFLLLGLFSFTQLSFAQEEASAEQQQVAPSNLKDNVIAWTESAIAIITESGVYERNLLGGLDSFLGQAVSANDSIQNIIGDSVNKLVDISPITDYKLALPVLNELLENLKK